MTTVTTVTDALHRAHTVAQAHAARAVVDERAARAAVAQAVMALAATEPGTAARTRAQRVIRQAVAHRETAELRARMSAAAVYEALLRWQDAVADERETVAQAVTAVVEPAA